jgi:hypothetical protein
MRKKNSKTGDEIILKTSRVMGKILLENYGTDFYHIIQYEKNIMDVIMIIWEVLILLFENDDLTYDISTQNFSIKYDLYLISWFLNDTQTTLNIHLRKYKFIQKNDVRNNSSD